jgi:hypothetical protein
MPEIMDAFTDDQIALMGCFAALLVTGTLMSLSFYIGKGARDRASDAARPKSGTLPLPTAAHAAPAARKRAA